MLTDARIRLEGRLEVLEGATRALADARALVKQGNWPAAKAALQEAAGPRVVEATGQAQSLALTEAELLNVLRRLDAARRQLIAAVDREARARGVGTASAEAKLDALLAQQVLFEAELRSGWAIVVPFFALPALGIAAMAASKGAWVAVPFVLAFVGLFSWQYARAPRVVVAQDVIVVGGRATAVTEIERVTFQPGFLKDTFQMTLRLRHGSVGFTLPTLPGELVEAVRALGLEVSHRSFWLA
jgi:hypothetical protein